MGRLIDADVYADKMRKKQNECKNLINEAKSEEERDRWNSVFMTFIEAKLTLDNVPTVDAEPVRHGKWILHDEDGPMFLYSNCSLCKFEQSVSHYLSYCPSCGAKMDGGTDDAENRA